MMRTELPWMEIAKDVRAAIDTEMPGIKFVNVNRLADHIREHESKYPWMNGVSLQTCRGRCTRVMRHVFKWETYSKGNGRGTVFIRKDA